MSFRGVSRLDLFPLAPPLAVAKLLERTDRKLLITPRE